MENAYLNAIADHGASLITHLSVANGATELDELAVTRQPITWVAAVSGDIIIDGNVTFDVLGGSTVDHIQFWSAATGGTYYGSSSVTPESFGGAGQYVLDSGTIQHNVGA